MKILNFGSINIDHVYRVPHLVVPGETLAGKDLHHFPGGKGANQSVALAKAGLEVWHAGKIGGDGLWLKEILQGCGIKTDFIRSYDGPTGHTVIQLTPEGENGILLYGGGNRAITEDDADQTLAHFGRGDYLVVQNEISSMAYILKAARERGMEICLNPAPFEKEIFNWPLDSLGLLVVNEVEGQALAGRTGAFKDLLDTLCRTYPETDILLTAGKAGAFFGRGAVREFVPAGNGDVIDTTAAGDTFFGYFLSSRIKGLPVSQSLERAAAAAALTISRKGAMDAIPFAYELD